MIVGSDILSSEGHVNRDSVLPPLCDLDMGVIENLPPDVFSELNNRYGGKLISLMSKRRGKLAESNIGGMCSLLEVVVLTLQPNCQTKCSLLFMQSIIYTFDFDVGMASEERGTSVPSVVPLRPCKAEKTVCFTFFLSLSFSIIFSF